MLTLRAIGRVLIEGICFSGRVWFKPLFIGMSAGYLMSVFTMSLESKTWTFFSDLELFLLDVSTLIYEQIFFSLCIFYWGYFFGRMFVRAVIKEKQKILVEEGVI